MRKNSPNSSDSNRPRANNSFKKDDGNKDYNKASKPFKKNYDGRERTAGASGEGPSRSSKPYSGRTADSTESAGGRKRSFEKPSFGGGRPGGDRSDARKSDKPFSDRPKRSFDKPSFRKDDERSGDKPFSDRPKRSFDKPSFRKDDSRSDKPFSDRPKRSFDKPSFRKEDGRGGDKPFSDRPKRSFDKPSFGKEDGAKPFSDRPKRSFDKPSFRKEESRDGDKPARSSDRSKSGGDSRPFRERPKPAFNKPAFKKDYSHADNEDPAEGDDAAASADADHPYKERKERTSDKKPGKKRHIHDHSEGRKKRKDDDDDDDYEDGDKVIDQKDGPRLEMPLNKYIAHSGECSRRDAAELVRQGKVKVNDVLILDPGHRVKHDDRVSMSGKKLTPQKGMVYILLNKPKGFITTNEDPQGRKTVMQLVGNAGVDRLFPVGRLDRDTSGLLLITNDGDLTQKLCHPSYKIKKVYQVTLDKPLTKADFEKVIEGVELEDGKAIVDAISYLEKKNELGLEIHSGRNRIVRRIFESLGYVVDKLDRVMYAGLTKKNLPRSKWRYLDEREVVLLKHFKN